MRCHRCAEALPMLPFRHRVRVLQPLPPARSFWDAALLMLPSKQARSSVHLSICTFPHSCESTPFTQFSFSQLLSSLSPQIHLGFQLLMGPFSLPLHPRTIQFCRTSLGCLSPEKSNCSRSAGAARHKILCSDIKARFIHGSEGIAPCSRRLPQQQRYVSLHQLRLDSKQTKVQKLHLKSKFVRVYQIQET